MKLIIGLGNPGENYQQTRHNLGFKVVEKISSLYKIKLNKSKFQSLFGEGKIKEEKVILAKPLTFMNLSGEVIVPLQNAFKFNLKDIIVIYDDLDLEIGKIRIREKGSSGGHKGIKSIIDHLKTTEFGRIRMGIGRPPLGLINETDYVLGKFSTEEKKIVIASIREAVKAIETIIEEGIVKAMNRYNTL